jgi:DNA-binding MarR family transcriptional regulator
MDFRDQRQPQDYKAINIRCSCFNFRRATRIVTQYFDQMLEPAGIRATQFTLLVSMAAASASTLTEMANSLLMDRTTLTRNLKPLEKLGLIMNVTAKDKRSKAYKLTGKGMDVLQRSVPLWEKAQDKIENGLGKERYLRLLKEMEVVAKMVGAF